MTQYELDLAAVKQNGCALYYVEAQTNEICLAAVKEYGCALYYVKTQTKEMCLEAVKQNGYALQFVKTQTNEICLEAAKRNGNALEYIRDFPQYDFVVQELSIDFVETNAWDIIKVNDVVTVGCQKHSINAWLAFSDTEINKMHDGALEFYNDVLKPYLLTLK